MPSSLIVSQVHVDGFEVQDGRTSKANEAESDAVRVVVAALLKDPHQLEPSQIGVITPYKAQQNMMSSQLQAASSSRGVEVATIDSFQGREKEIIIMSCVRANSSGSVGFLGDVRRMNVAFTRARRGLIVIGHPPTLEQQHTVWRQFCGWARSHGVIIPLSAIRQVVDRPS